MTGDSHPSWSVNELQLYAPIVFNPCRRPLEIRQPEAHKDAPTPHSLGLALGEQTHRTGVHFTAFQAVFCDPIWALVSAAI